MTEIMTESGTDQIPSYNSQNNRFQKESDDQLSSEYEQSTESTEPRKFASSNKFAILSQVQIEDLSTQENQHDIELTITSNLKESTLNSNSGNVDESLNNKNKYTNDKRHYHQAKYNTFKTKLIENVFIVRNLGINRLSVYLVDLPSFKMAVELKRTQTNLKLKLDYLT